VEEDEERLVSLWRQLNHSQGNKQGYTAAQRAQCSRVLSAVARIRRARSEPIVLGRTAAITTIAAEATLEPVTAEAALEPVTAKIPLTTAAKAASVAVAAASGEEVAWFPNPAEHSEPTLLAVVEALVQRVQGLTELCKGSTRVRHRVSTPAKPLGRIRGLRCPVVALLP